MTELLAFYALLALKAPWNLGVWLVMFAVICQAGPEGRRKVLQARINRIGLGG